MKKWLNIYLVLDKRYKEHIYFCPWKKRWLQPRKIKNAAPKIFITYLLGAVARTHWWITLKTLPRRFMRSMESKNTPDDLPQAANLGPLTSRAKRRRSKGSVCVCVTYLLINEREVNGIESKLFSFQKQMRFIT